MRKKNYFLLISFFIAITFGETCIAQDSVIDIDGNSYPTIKMGNQIWMAKNLASTHYSNGEEITSYSRTSAWMRMTGVNYKNINRSTVPKEFAFSIRCVKD